MFLCPRIWELSAGKCSEPASPSAVKIFNFFYLVYCLSSVFIFAQLAGSVDFHVVAKFQSLCSTRFEVINYFLFSLAVDISYLTVILSQPRLQRCQTSDNFVRSAVVTLWSYGFFLYFIILISNSLPLFSEGLRTPRIIPYFFNYFSTLILRVWKFTFTILVNTYFFFSVWLSEGLELFAPFFLFSVLLLFYPYFN